MPDDSALATLMGAYFHQDVFDTYVDEFAAVDDFVSGAPDLASALVDDISAVLASHSSEHDLRDHLDELGNAIEPDPGVTYREWLTQIADRARTGHG